MSGSIDENGKLTLNYSGLEKISFPDMLRAASRDKDFILLGDSHDEASIIRNTLSPESIAAMRDVGVKNLVLEFSVDQQYIFDGYASGKFSFEQVQQAFASFSNSGLTGEDLTYMRQRIPEAMRELRDAGIKVHCVDLPINDPRRKGHGPDDAMNAFKDDLEGRMLTPRQIQDYLDQREKTEPGISDRFNANYSAGMELRFSYDREIADRVRPLAEEGKVAMLYGVMHFTRDNDINEFLGAERSAVIRMHDSQVGTELGFNKQYDAPEYVFFDRLSDKNPVSAGGKLEPVGQYSDACALAVNQLKSGLTGNLILACVTPDQDFHDFASSRLQTPATTAPAKTVGGPS